MENGKGSEISEASLLACTLPFGQGALVMPQDVLVGSAPSSAAVTIDTPIHINPRAETIVLGLVIEAY